MIVAACGWFDADPGCRVVEVFSAEALVAVEAGWLWFWRLKPGKTADPARVCEQLVDDNAPAELETLPAEEVLAALQAHYPTLELDRDTRAGDVDLPDEQTAFELRWSNRHFAFTFYGDAWKQMDCVVDLMTKLSLPCYDFGERKMYTTKRPPRFTGTRDEEAIVKEWERVMMEESAKIEATSPNRLEAVMRKKKWVDSGGMQRAREEAIRRVQARKGV